MNPNGLPQPGPVQGVSQPQPAQFGVSPQPAVPSTVLSPDVAASQAKQLVLQYQSNPYALSEAFQQLKSGYLEQQFNVSVDAPGL